MTVKCRSHLPTWRELRVTYPERFATRNRTQLYYFVSHGVQRRMDY
jgi:hypothetical protein